MSSSPLAQSGSGGRTEVVGVGCAALDYLGVVSGMPSFDDAESVKAGPWLISGGGPVATALVTLARLGVPASYLGVLGEDIVGQAVRAEFVRAGVAVDHLRHDPALRSFTSFVLVEQGTGRRAFISFRGADPAFDWSPQDRDVIRQAQFLHLDGWYPQIALPAARIAREAGVQVCLDAYRVGEGTADWVALTDVLVAPSPFPRGTPGKRSSSEPPKSSWTRGRDWWWSPSASAAALSRTTTSPFTCRDSPSNWSILPARGKSFMGPSSTVCCRAGPWQTPPRLPAPQGPWPAADWAAEAQSPRWTNSKRFWNGSIPNPGRKVRMELELEARMKSLSLARIAELERVATKMRRQIVDMYTLAGGGHFGGSMSVVETLVTLYGAVVRVNLADPEWGYRDRVVLSKGHAWGALCPGPVYVDRWERRAAIMVDDGRAAKQGRKRSPMTLVSGQAVLAHARRARCAMSAFNADNMEVVQAIVRAAQDERAPVILQVSVPTIHYAGLEMAAAMIKAAAAQVEIPVVLHLDHGDTFELNARCLDQGFTSLMFDGSALPYAENVAETARIVARAHPAGMPVEAELGRVLHDGATAGEVAAAMTDPDQAADFVRRTGCDSLAVAVGSVHAMRVSCAELDIDRVRAISHQTGVPLVLHGGSGIREDSLLAAVAGGVSKVNVGTYLKQGFVLGMSAAMAEAPGEADFRRYLAPARDEARERVRAKIRLLGSAGLINDGGGWRSPPAHQPVNLPGKEAQDAP